MQNYSGEWERRKEDYVRELGKKISICTVYVKGLGKKLVYCICEGIKAENSYVKGWIDLLIILILW